MSHDPRAWCDIRAIIRKGEQRSVKTSGEFGVTVDLWYGTLGCWAASARSEVLFDFIDECDRCALMSHDPRAWCDIRAIIRKGEQRSVKTSGEFGGTVDLCYGTLGCWASARSEVLFDFIDECARCALMSHDPRAWWDIRAIRKDE